MLEYKLTYFDIRGIAEPIRLLFALAGVPFEDNRIPYCPPGVGLPAPIDPAIRQKLPYGVVPILEFDGQILSQTNAIGRFLARKFDLYGKDELEAAKIDEIVDACTDYFEDCRRGLRGSKSEEERKAGLRSIVHVATPKYLGKFNQILKENGGQFFVGQKTTLADIMVFHHMTEFAGLVGVDLIKNYPALQTFERYVASIPNIEKWLDGRPVSLV